MDVCWCERIRAERTSDDIRIGNCAKVLITAVYFQSKMISIPFGSSFAACRGCRSDDHQQIGHQRTVSSNCHNPTPCLHLRLRSLCDLVVCVTVDNTVNAACTDFAQVVRSRICPRPSPSAPMPLQQKSSRRLRKLPSFPFTA